jgi:hypothetical protein
MRVSSRLLADERKQINCHFVSGFLGHLKQAVHCKTFIDLQLSCDEQYCHFYVQRIMQTLRESSKLISILNTFFIQFLFSLSLSSSSFFKINSLV